MSQTTQAEPPLLEGQRIVLRPFRFEDAPTVERLAGAQEVADTTLSIPHPYPKGAAESWIATHRPACESGMGMTWAICGPSDEVLGAISLGMMREQGSGELAYWVGVPYWNNGYATEAGRLVLRFAFEVLNLHRVDARHMTRNLPSGRVLQKLGMRQEGVHQETRRAGRLEDVASYSILRTEWPEA